MKKYLTLWMLFFFTLILLSCNTQKKLKLDKNTTYNLPKQFKEISKKDVLQKFKDFDSMTILDFSDNLYLADNMVIGIYHKPDFVVFSKEKPFSYYKSLYTYAFKLSSSYNVNDIGLKTYKNVNYIIEDYSYKNDNIYHFKYYINDYNTNIGGYIRYDKNTPKADAKKLLEEILNNVEIKGN